MSSAYWQGLNYAGVKALMDMTPSICAGRREELFSEIRIMELAALEVLNAP